MEIVESLLLNDGDCNNKGAEEHFFHIYVFMRLRRRSDEERMVFMNG